MQGDCTILMLHAALIFTSGTPVYVSAAVCQFFGFVVLLHTPSQSMYPLSLITLLRHSILITNTAAATLLQDPHCFPSQSHTVAESRCTPVYIKRAHPFREAGGVRGMPLFLNADVLCTVAADVCLQPTDGALPIINRPHAASHPPALYSALHALLY